MINSVGINIKAALTGDLLVRDGIEKYKQREVIMVSGECRLNVSGSQIGLVNDPGQD